jgi:hypothetical protein
MIPTVGFNMRKVSKGGVTIKVIKYFLLPLITRVTGHMYLKSIVVFSTYNSVGFWHHHPPKTALKQSLHIQLAEV